MKFKLISILSLFVLMVVPVSATTIYVPQNYSTIQGGIDASSDGDTVLVSNGTYNENITISGKAITLQSINGAENTFINATGTAIFIENADDYVTIDGFTVSTNSTGDGGDNAAICIKVSSSMIRVINNILNATSAHQAYATGVRLNYCEDSII